MAAQHTLQLKVSISGRAIETLNFSDEEISIGRDPASMVFLDNLGVSRKHAKIEPTESGYRLTDLQSSNGTFLNEQPVQESDLKDGDQLQIGKFTVTVGITKQSPAAADSGPDDDVLGEGTVVLEPEERDRLIAESREAERPAAAQRAEARSPTQRASSSEEPPPPLTLTRLFLYGAVAILLVVWLLD